MSSLTEVKSLLARLRSQLGSAADATAGADVEEFATLCRGAQARLAECGRLQAAGNLEKAVRLAEEEPELVELADWIARTEKAPGWASFASQRGLPEVPALGAGTSERLLTLYRTWNNTSEFLWRKYRDTMMRRDEDAAVIISQRIFRIDPSDHAARDEVNRVGRRTFKEKVARIGEDLECGDTAAAIELVTQLDRVPFDDLKVGAAWDAAIKLRNAHQREINEGVLARLIAALPGLVESQDLEGVQRIVSQAEDMVKRLGLNPGDDGRQIKESKTWIKEETDRRELAVKLEAALDRCRRQVSKIETNWATLKSGPVSELESALRKLSNCWSEVEKAGTNPGAELPGKVASLRQKLKSRIARDAGRRKRRALVIKVAIGMVAFAAAYYLYSQWRGGRITDRLAELQTERKALSVKSTLDRAEKWSRPVIYLARIRPEIDRAHAWFGREELHRKSVATMTESLEGSMVNDFDGPATTEFHGKMEALKNEISDAAVDMQPDLNSGASSLFKAWDAHVKAFVADRHNKRESALTELNESLADMPELSRAGRDEKFALRLAETATNLDEWTQPTIPEASIRPEIEAEMRAIGPRLGQALEALATFRETLLSLQDAKTFPSYLSALSRFTNAAALTNTPERAAAAALLANNSKELTITGQILAPADPAGWKWFVKNRDKPEFLPGSVAEPERLILKALSEDKNLSGIYACHFRKRPGGKSFYVHSSGPTVERVRRAGATVIDRSGTFFDGASFKPSIYTLKSGRGSQLISESLSSESALFEKIQPDQHVMSQSQQSYLGSLNPIFEQIMAAEDANPTFRAYLQSQLGSVLLKRPHQWGSVLNPQLIADLERLREIGARSLASADWMTPDLNPDRAKLIREFYAGARNHRYALEAKLNRKLIELALEDGLAYAGFVDIDGSLMVIPAAESATELYGHSDPNQPARLLFQKPTDGATDAAAETSGPGARWEQLADGAPLTALFYFKGDREQLLEDVAAELEIATESARALALPFFAGN